MSEWVSGHNVKTIRQRFKERGVFYTPPELAQFMRSLVDFTPVRVYDPTCGDGSLLAQFDDTVEKYGQEIDETQLSEAANRLVNFVGLGGDTLVNDMFEGVKFDAIVANPPFSIKWNPALVESDVRFAQYPTVPSGSRADYAFIMHIIHHMTENGVAVVMNSPGVLYRGGRERTLRECIVRSKIVSRVIDIPGGAFDDTAIGTCVIVFDKRQVNNTVSFERYGSDELVTISVHDIEDNDFSLSVNTYITTSVDKPMVDPLMLNNDCRRSAIDAIERDVRADAMVAEIEGYDVGEYIDAIVSRLELLRGELSR